MAEGLGTDTVAGINVREFLTGFEDEDVVLKKLARQASTPTRQFVWMQKTAGYISPVTTTGQTLNLIVNSGQRGLSPIVEQTFTRNTSNVKDYAATTELITQSDEKDLTVDYLGIIMRDAQIAVSSQVDVSIYNVGTESLSPSNILSTASVADGWDDAVTGNPILDILTGLQKIRAQRYIISATRKGALYINSIEHKNLMNFLISVKGSSLGEMPSSLLVQGAVMEILNLDVIVSENATTDYAWMFIPNVTVAWTTFIGLSSEVERIVGKGKKVHIWESGLATLENPKSSHLTTDTVV
jgi:hypothetical protein